MRFLVDGGQFGFLLAQRDGQGMYRFQIVVEGNLIGDAEPSILGTAMRQLRNLPRLDSDKFDQTFANPSAVMSRLQDDEELHDATTLALAESLDQWQVHGFRHGGNVVMLMSPCSDDMAGDRLLASIVDAAEYDVLLDVIYLYWSTTSGAQ
jgi:hypothetical protein